MMIPDDQLSLLMRKSFRRSVERYLTFLDLFTRNTKIASEH